MKKTIALLSLLILAMLGCKKDSKTDNAMQYSINGISDVTFKSAKQSIAISITHVSGPQEAVNLSVTGMPTGMSYTLSTTSGTPSFSTIFEISRTSNVTKGIYPIKFTSTTAAGVAKSVDFKLIVESSCPEALEGKYDDMSDPSIPYEYTVSTKSDNPNRLYFYQKGFSTPDYYGDIDCGTGIITVPNQPYFELTAQNVSGTGTFSFSPKSITLNLTVTFGGASYPYTVKYVGK